jgi:hypothetical protein
MGVPEIADAQIVKHLNANIKKVSLDRWPQTDIT